jgi:GntR family transcriptional repressor for pyruvate dehydrogenase complex
MKAEKTISIRPIRKKTVPEEIIHELKSLIDSGKITPGSKLPPERELARMLNVSRPSLREALRALSLLGIVDNRHGSGTYLASSPDRWPLEPFSILLSLNKGALLDIFEARKSLEGTVAALAARRRNDDDLKSMQEALGKMRVNVRNYGTYTKHELRFHKAIVEAAGNRVISDLMNKLYRLLIDTRKRVYRDASETPSYLDEDLRHHEEIFERIKSGDEQMAIRTMTDHLLLFEQRLKDEEGEEEREETE